MILSFLALALAHPSGAGNPADPAAAPPGQRVEVSVAPGRLRVDYFVQLPAIRLYKEARLEGAAGEGWAAARAQALRAGLSVRVDGALLALESTSAPPATFVGTAEVELHLAAEGDLPPLPTTVELRMDNFPDESSYYAASVTVDGALVVTETNLGHVVSGHLRDNRHGAWQRGEAARAVTFSLRATRPWEGHAPGPLPERLEGLVPLEGWVWWSGWGAALVATLSGGWAAWRRALRAPGRVRR